MAYFSIASLFASGVKMLPQVAVDTVKQHLELSTRKTTPTNQIYGEFETVVEPNYYEDDSIVITNDSESGLRLSRAPEEEILSTVKGAPENIFYARKVGLLTSVNHDGMKKLFFRRVEELTVTVIGDATGLLEALGECCSMGRLEKLTINGTATVTQTVSFGEIFKMFPYLEELTIPIEFIEAELTSDWMAELVETAPYNRLCKLVFVSENEKMLKFKADDLANLMKKAYPPFRMELKLAAYKTATIFKALRKDMLSVEGGSFTINLEEGENYIIAAFQKIDEIQNPADWLHDLAFNNIVIQKVFITTSFEFLQMIRREDVINMFEHANVGAILEVHLHVPSYYNIYTGAVARICARNKTINKVPVHISSQHIGDFLTVNYRRYDTNYL
uniref:FTH domain-containing protein n=1 Tax=Panagrellus redivivus TaxID=6233 RepID=A0A7E4VRB6_PANRE